MDKLPIDKDVFKVYQTKNNLTYKDLSEKTHLSPATISAVVNHGGEEWKIKLLAPCVGVRDWHMLLTEEGRRRLDEQAVPPGTYLVTWKTFTDGAEDIGKEMFLQLKVNTVLTFAGPSMIFAGLTMAKVLTKEEIVRMPVYTAIFIDKKMSSEDFPQFDPIPVRRFKLLVPRALMQNFPDREKRIGVIDDAILTGKTMDALRNYFDGLERKPACVEFACHVCNDSQTIVKDQTPKHNVATSDKNIQMPWGNDAFAFDNCFAGSPGANT